MTMTSEKRGKKRGSPKGAPKFINGGVDLPAPAAPQGGISDTVKSDAMTQAMLSNPQHELYAQAVADGCSYVEAYRRAGYASDTANAHRAASIPAVAARIRMLRTAAAERSVHSIAARMDLLDTIAHTDASEVFRVVSAPCSACWSDVALADAMARALAGKGDMPNPDAAQPDCKACRGTHRIYDITPTDQLSAAGRAIFRGVKVTANGLEPILADRQAAINALNAMQPGALAATRSMSLNVNGFIPAARDVSPEELERLLASFDD